MSLTVDIEKKLDSFLLSVSFTADDGVLSLLGPSGSGKSMILRCISGIEKPDCGRIVLNGRVLFDSERHINMSPQQRRTGYLFQNYALFPNMTVLENIMCSIRRERRISSEDKIKMAADMVARMRLSDVVNRKATELSGGQMQRAALARILLNDADIMMLDEPFSALDEHLRFTMEKELSAVIRDFGKTVLLVSHNRDEVYRMADHVAVLNSGRIEHMGTVKNVFAAPATVTAARLTGIKNIAPASFDPDGMLVIPGWGVSVPHASPGCSVCRDLSAVAAAGIRMNDIKLPSQKAGAGRVYTLTVDRVVENLFSYTVELHNPAVSSPLPLYWQVSRDIWHPDGAETIDLFFPDKAVAVLAG